MYNKNLSTYPKSLHDESWTEEFQRYIKAIADNVPDHMKSTIGGNMNWIVSQAFILHFQPKLAELEARIKELEYANEERGLQESQRDEKVTAKAARGRKE